MEYLYGGSWIDVFGAEDAGKKGIAATAIKLGTFNRRGTSGMADALEATDLQRESATQSSSTNLNGFDRRHLGVGAQDLAKMLESLGASSLDELMEQVIPEAIRIEDHDQRPAHSEVEALQRLKELAGKNQVFRSYIGMGYSSCYTPSVILRNVLQNPAWYTAYTPYQPEISQGRLEALLNYQTMVSDLTGLEIANASLLDESTAAAEAMSMAWRCHKGESNRFFVAADVHPQTQRVLATRAEPLGIEIVVGEEFVGSAEPVFGALFQYPGTFGDVRDYRAVIERVHEAGGLAIMAADLMSLTMLASPGEMGADIAIGSTQRFGIPLFFGGPHAAYFATKSTFKRSIPGRLIGVSRDSGGQVAYRMALQTREQHIRRDRATSNICTAQALLAIAAGLYAAYHGPNGLRQIAERIHARTCLLADRLRSAGYELVNSSWFDTLTVKTAGRSEEIHQRAAAAKINFRKIDENRIGIALDETTALEDLSNILNCFAVNSDDELTDASVVDWALPRAIARTSDYLTHPVFKNYQTETEMMRYLRRLADKDLALDRTMIPLGSCTMKLNAATEMIPVTWPAFCDIHPYAPEAQTVGYGELIDELERMLCEATGYDAVSLQPNAGSQGEFSGLLAIRAYHASRGESNRDVCLIPQSAHGTNPASAIMAGMKVVVVQCDEQGNIDLDELRGKAEQHSAELAAMMITYPSTHGVFEENVSELCDIIHQHGGQVYIDGANLNAQVGLCEPGAYGGDVSHLNLHKTFCIPHGGGGPGVGPVAVRSHLAPFLPGNPLGGDSAVGPVAGANWGSAGILPISWAYIFMMGDEGLRRASEVAILNANYVARRLSAHYSILYTGENDRVAHECIVDCRSLAVGAEGIAKRLVDYGFHAPTMSFPVPGTLMIEPTESESKAELDRFCDAMIQIRDEIQAVEDGVWDAKDNPLVNAPHTAAYVTKDDWTHTYSRQTAAYPTGDSRNKYWPPVGRIDQAFGDRNLICSCPPLSEYDEMQ